MKKAIMFFAFLYCVNIQSSEQRIIDLYHIINTIDFIQKRDAVEQQYENQERLRIIEYT